jgi:hypothetical protein
MSVNLVTTDSVRAVLGVSAQELPDTVLTNSIYATQLREDMFDMHPQMTADFATLSALTDVTSDQERFLDLAQAYAAYNVAWQCLTSLPMFAPQTIKDEKSELTRNADFYAQLRTDVGAVLDKLGARLRRAYAAVNANAPAPVTVDRIFGLAVGLASDPVTGA